MTYPPNNPGYPPAPQSGSQFDVTQQFAKAAPAHIPAAPPAAPAPGESSLPQILLGVVAAAGLCIYLVSFALEAGLAQGMLLLVAAPLLAALLAGVSLLPKQKNYAAICAVTATIPFLFVIGALVGAGAAVDWPVWALLVLTLVQAGAAITALLVDAGVVTPPAPKPQFDQPYGQYGGPSQYYGQQQQPGGQHYQQAPQGPGYPSQYGGYPGGGQSTGGYPVQPPQSQQSQQSQQQPSGPPTPPTGYPTYGQPQQGSAQAAQSPESPSQQSGPAPS